MDALLESNCRHGSSCLGVGHELSMIFSKAKNEAWSQYKYLQGNDELKEAKINITSHGKLVLKK